MTIVLNKAMLAASLLLASCSSDIRTSQQESAPSQRSDETPAIDPCTSATNENRMRISEHERGLVSICRLDEAGDCLYTEAFGKTFISDRPDLNNDGHVDMLVRDFTGAYGNHDIVHYLGYAACPQEGYVSVLDIMATNIEFETSQNNEWVSALITRDCYDEETQSPVSRQYTLTWNHHTGHYGPPDNDPGLSEYCTDKEMSLPILQ